MYTRCHGLRIILGIDHSHYIRISHDEVIRRANIARGDPEMIDWHEMDQPNLQKLHSKSTPRISEAMKEIRGWNLNSLQYISIVKYLEGGLDFEVNQTLLTVL